MPMNLTVEHTSLPGVLVLTPRVFRDPRGFLLESYQARDWREAGVECEFVQDNRSRSVKSVVRGLHYQFERPQAKLVSVVAGEVLDVVLDLRRGSPTFGQWASVLLSEKNFRQIFIPAGFAHGLAVLSDEAEVHYKCDDYYDPDGQFGVAWDDPDLGIDWGVEEPILSDKDRALPRLRDLPASHLPLWENPEK